MARFSEDMSVFSANFLRDGRVAKSANDVCGKLWSCLHPQDGEKFLKWVEEHYPDAVAQETCHSWVNHRNFIFNPQELLGYMDQFFMHQRHKDMVVTYTNTMHFGVNSDKAPSYAESINFAPLIGDQLTWTQESFQNLRRACWGRCHELPVINIPLLLSKSDEKKKIRTAELDETWVVESRLSLVLQDIQDIINGTRVECDEERLGLEMLRDAAAMADERKVQELLNTMDDEKASLCEIRKKLSDVFNLDFDEEEIIFDDVWFDRMDKFESDVKKAKQLTSMFYF